MVVRGELPSLAAKPLVSFSGSLDPPARLFNATLDYVDEAEQVHPYLAEAVPKLNSDTWRVFPDGRMETTYQLRPALTWHDGSRLTAEDFAFAWRVYATPEFGTASSAPIGEMEEVLAPDPSTVVIRWKRPYPEAAEMDREFQALPRHILEPHLQSLDALSFVNHAFWTTEYVGLGPYRLDAWEPGAFIEGVAFDGHALGRARIQRIRVTFIPDANTALANLLGGEAHFISDYVLAYQEGVTLESEWQGNNGGTVLWAPVLMRITHVQQRPEYASSPALLDVRVRKAFAHAVDVPAAVEALTGNKGLATYTLTSPAASYYPEVERAITKHPFDPRRTQQLMEEAGFHKGADGFFVSPPEFGGEVFRVEAWHSAGAAWERENAILVDNLRRAGIDAVSKVTPAAMIRDAKARATTPGLATAGMGQDRWTNFTSDAIPGPDNRWHGNNRGAWSNPDYDRAYQAFNTSLDRSERIRHIAQMERVLTEQMGAIPYLFTVVVTAHTANLKGPTARRTPDAGVGPVRVHTWEWTK
jgi:peptide/nickel transport system substrate-binding protein